MFNRASVQQTLLLITMNIIFDPICHHRLQILQLQEWHIETEHSCRVMLEKADRYQTNIVNCAVKQQSTVWLQQARWDPKACCRHSSTGRQRSTESQKLLTMFKACTGSYIEGTE